MLRWLEQHFEIGVGAASRNQPMEGLRGLAVILVFFVHYATAIKPWIGEIGATARLAYGLFLVGNTGVDLFFVLSGFLIYGALVSKKRSYTHFLARRVQRIYPAFLAVFLLYLLTSWLIPGAGGKLPSGGLERFGYLTANLLLLPGMLAITPLIQVAWSLSYEFFFYLICPLLIGILNMREMSSVTRMLIILVLSVLWLAWSFAVSDSHIRLVMFAAGMLLHEVCLDRRMDARHPLAGPAVVLAWAGYYTMVMNRAESVAALVLLYVCYFVLCHEAFTQQGLTARVLRFTPLRWLGNMSFSFYLLHAFMIHGAFFALKAILAPTADAPYLFYLLAVPVLIFALAGSAVLFLLIERPLSLGERPVISL